MAVIPARDEAPRIHRVLGTLPPFVDAVVVVDDGSVDGTLAQARALAEPRLTTLRHDTSRGVGAAIVAGYRRARELSSLPTDAFVVLAGDGQMDPRDLEAVVLPVIRDKADYVKGNRFAWPGAHRLMPPARYVGGHLFSWATSLALGTPVSDSQCGYTALSRAAADRLDLEALWPGYGYPNALLAELVARGLRIQEVPVRPVYADEVSRLRLRHLPAIAGILLRAWQTRRASSPRAGVRLAGSSASPRGRAPRSSARGSGHARDRSSDPRSPSAGAS